MKIGVLISVLVFVVCAAIVGSYHPAEVKLDGTNCRLRFDNGRIVTFRVSSHTECIRLHKVQQEKTK